MQRTILAACALTASLVAASAPAAQPDAIDCDHYRAPPDHDQFELADVPIASGQASAAEQAARDKARDALLKRLAPTGCGATGLRAGLRQYRVGHSKDRVCADALIENKAYESWRALYFTDRIFKDQVGRAAAGAVEAWRSNQAKGAGKPRVAVQVPVKHAEFYGWLAAAWNEAVGAAGGQPVALSGKWTGIDMPAGIDVVATPRVVAQSADPDLLRVDWEIRLGDLRKVGAIIRSATSNVSACVAPPRRDEAALVPFNAPLRVEVKGSRPGVFCEGDKVELHLVSTAAEPLHVRVLDLWGEGGALLLWPTQPGQGVVTPGQRVALAEANTAIVLVNPTGLTSERVIVLAAKSAAALDAAIGAVKDRIGCMVEHAAGSAMARWRGPPEGAMWTQVEIAFSTDQACAQPNTALRLRAAEALAAMPVCK